MAVQASLTLDNNQDWVPISANPAFGLPDTFPNPGRPFHPLRISDVLAHEFERQRHETDLFLQFQSEKFKYAIVEQKKKQTTAILESIESRAMAMVRKTEQDLAKATRRTKELEERLRKAEMEAWAWQGTAQENEALVVGLNKTLAQARERQLLASGGVGPAQDAESTTCECGGEKLTWKMSCKGCKSEKSCVVFLPCKHLCACRQCGSALRACPVCKAQKEGSVEVFLT